MQKTIITLGFEGGTGTQTERHWSLHAVTQLPPDFIEREPRRVINQWRFCLDNCGCQSLLEVFLDWYLMD